MKQTTTKDRKIQDLKENAKVEKQMDATKRSQYEK
jgi:hypothetical protein